MPARHFFTLAHPRFFLTPDRSKFPPRLHKAHVEGKPDQGRHEVKLRLRGGAKGHNMNDSTLPGSAAPWAASFQPVPMCRSLFCTERKMGMGSPFSPSLTFGAILFIMIYPVPHPSFSPGGRLVTLMTARCWRNPALAGSTTSAFERGHGFNFCQG